ncbi:MAG: hypothetical protein LBK26_00005 [Rickettsiales bacterium]|jgi:hypothetical protein|nr:hypothetical protein [Rickettsiales bacterium]
MNPDDNRNLRSAAFQIAELCAPLCAHFVKWAAAAARYPARVILRDGEIFQIIGREMVRLGVPEFKSCADWTAHYATTMMTLSLNENLEKLHVKESYFVKQFLEQNGWRDHHTFIDTGFSGTIVANLQNSGFPIQPLFMISKNPEIESFFATDEMHAELSKYQHIDPIDVGYHILDCFPKRVESPTACDISFSYGKYRLHLDRLEDFDIDMHKSFMRGVKSYAAKAARRGLDPLGRSVRAMMDNAEDMKSVLELLSYPTDTMEFEMRLMRLKHDGELDRIRWAHESMR